MSTSQTEAASERKVTEISIAHSPDSDDAFMFYGLATNKVRVPGYRFTHTLSDIETLNRRAQSEAYYDVSAISFHAYPYVQENYTLMGCGGSVGEGYGPMIVSRMKLSQQDLRRVRVAVPGTLTTAYLALKIFNPEIETVVVPFDRIIPEILAGNYDAGLIIHEGQLTFQNQGLHLVVDLGVWWMEKTGLPLPLGGNVVRRDLGADTIRQISRLLKESIRYSLDHRDAALAYALQYARDMDKGLADRFVGMYVNEWTLDYGPRGREAVRRLLEEGHRAGVIPSAVDVEFVE